MIFQQHVLRQQMIPFQFKANPLNRAASMNCMYRNLSCSSTLGARYFFSQYTLFSSSKVAAFFWNLASLYIIGPKASQSQWVRKQALCQLLKQLKSHVYNKSFHLKLTMSHLNENVGLISYYQLCTQLYSYKHVSCCQNNYRKSI